MIACGILAFVAASIQPYGWRPSSLFHLDHTIADTHPLPTGTVVLDVPAYDGAGYYQLARSMPQIAQPSEWAALRQTTPGPYAYQRFLLPLVAFIVTLGNDTVLPWAFLSINILCVLLLATFLRKKYPEYWLPHLALCFSPAIVLGLHFSLAEPITVLCATIFLVRFANTKQLDLLTVLLLCTLVLAREVMVLFVGAVALWLVIQKRWRDLPWLLLPFGVFTSLHTLIYLISHQIPFLWSAEKHTLPFQAIFELITGKYGYNSYTLTSIPLALGFVLPGFLWTGSRIWQKDLRFEIVAAFCFFSLMTLMPDYIWGSITSIGRVITPIYPLCWLSHCRKPSRFSAYLLTTILIIGIYTALGLASVVHPYHVL